VYESERCCGCTVEEKITVMTVKALPLDEHAKPERGWPMQGAAWFDGLGR
jgi:hypothetical protein